MDLPTKSKPHWNFSATLPVVRNPHIRKPVFLGRCGIQEFGGSRNNETWTLFIFGWAVCRLSRLEYHNESDKERADRYLAEWSKCEKELRGLRLLQMGDEVQDPELRRLLRDGLGINLDEGTS